MKNIIIFFTIGLMLAAPSIVNANCFLAMENNKIVKQEGDCDSRHSPCSTFKIAISLMGYNEGILIDANHPELPFKEGHVDFIDSWKQSQNPRSWMKNSCVWYSQILTQDLGKYKFKEYLAKFNYGNQDEEHCSDMDSYLAGDIAADVEFMTHYMQTFSMYWQS